MKSKGVLLATLLVLLSFALLIGGRIPYFLLYTFILFLVIPLVHGRVAKNQLVGKIMVPEKEIYAGEAIEIRYWIENTGILPLPHLTIENTLAERLTGRKEQDQTIALGKEEVYRGSINLVCRRRGIYQLGGVQVLIHDIFNLYTLRKSIEESIFIKIYPQFPPLSSLSMKVSQQMGEILVNDPLFQNQTHFSDLRPYQIGDSMKRVHWKASSRSTDLVIKNFEARGDTEMMILLDSHPSSYEGDFERRLEDKAVEVVLSLVDYCLRQQIQVSLVYQQQNKRRCIQGNGPSFLKAFVEDMLTFEPRGNRKMEEELKEHTIKMNRGICLMVVTPELNRSLGTQSIDLKMKNIQVGYVLLEKLANHTKTSMETGTIKSKLRTEGIPIFSVALNQNLREVLEENYEKRA